MATCACKKNSSCRKIDTFKPLVPEDTEYFGKMDIYFCDECKLIFAAPQPPLEKLDLYYKNVYRRKDRPYYFPNPENQVPKDFEKSQYSYMSQFVDFSQIQSILDLGPGYGLLLREIKKRHKHIKIFAADPDTKSFEHLAKFDINCIDINNLNKENWQEFDLIITSHSLEHFSNPDDFFALAKKFCKKDGSIFIEVPNNPIDSDKYCKRPYDAPHLLFFTEPSLSYFIKKNGFDMLPYFNGWLFIRRRVKENESAF